ncbi:MAG: hypothetical protein AB7S80_05480 [Rhizobiaceae bacterium]
MSFSDRISAAGIHVVGYAAAVLVASIVTIIFVMAPAIVATGFTQAVIDNAGRLLAFGLVATGSMALPGFVFTVWLAGYSGWNRWTLFALAGLADAFVALVILQVYLGGMLAPELLLPCFPGGYAGGIAYWRATRSRWLAPTSPAPSKS